MPLLRLLLAATLALAATRGGAEDTATALRFEEVSRDLGLDFHHRHGGSGQRYMVETMVGGVVVFDYDDDGDSDVLWVDGGELPGYRGPPPKTRLMRNDGGRFVDVTGRAGLDFGGYGCGGVAGDADGDGDLDLYLTAFGRNAFYRNRGDGSFEEATDEAGVGEERWSASAAFADVDRDGDLDLYVVNYVDFALDNVKFCGDRERGISGYCHPDKYEGEPDRFYRNRGDGTFEDATAEAGLAHEGEAGLGAIFGDLDDDGWPDLYVANDLDPNFLFRNRGDGTFEDLSLLSGTALNTVGRPEAGMGVEMADLDGDLRLDIVVTNFSAETNALYRNMGGGVFVDRRFADALAEPTLLVLGFGTVAADFDHDGDLDLLFANGHILDNPEAFDDTTGYAQRNLLMENVGGGRFREATGHGIDEVRVSRGAAALDLEGDGDLDLAVINSNQPAEVYRNVGAEGGWLKVDLRSAAGNRFGVGGRVVVTAAGRSWLRELRTGSSYLSQGELSAHFGVGGAEEVERLEVRWPDGRRSILVSVPAERRLRLVAAAP